MCVRAVLSNFHPAFVPPTENVYDVKEYFVSISDDADTDGTSDSSD